MSCGVVIQAGGPSCRGACGELGDTPIHSTRRGQPGSGLCAPTWSNGAASPLRAREERATSSAAERRDEDGGEEMQMEIRLGEVVRVPRASVE